MVRSTDGLHTAVGRSCTERSDHIGPKGTDTIKMRIHDEDARCSSIAWLMLDELRRR